MLSATKEATRIKFTAKVGHFLHGLGLDFANVIWLVQLVCPYGSNLGTYNVKVDLGSTAHTHTTCAHM